MEVDLTYQQLRRQWFWKACWPVLVFSVLGALLAWLPLGPVDRFCFDLTSVLAWSKPPVKIVIVEIDNATKALLRQPPDRPLDRRLYAQALRRLKSEGTRLVVFDLLFDAPSENPGADSDFGKALNEHGAAILAVEIVENTEDSHHTLTVIKPIEALATNAAAWGSSAVAWDPDRGVRRHMTNPPVAPGLGAQAARLLGVPPPVDYESAGVMPPPRWLRWYATGEFRRIDFAALIQTTNSLSLSNAVVVIGAKPGPGLPGAVSDTFGSPWSRFNGGFVSGPTVHAVILGNYASGDWLRGMPWPLRALAGVLWAGITMLTAWRWNARRPAFVWLVPVVFIPLAALIAVTLLGRFNVWWPWMPVGFGLPLLAAFWLRWKPVPQPIDVFISYRREADGETAQLLYEKLNEKGIVTFYAPEKMPPGPFPEHLVRKIKHSRCIVFVVSPRTFAAEKIGTTGAPTQPSLAPDYVRVEIETAREAGKTFIPVLTKGFQFSTGPWPPELGPTSDWEMFTKVTYSGDGRINPAVEQIITHVREVV